MLNVLSALECTQAKPQKANDAQSKPKPFKLFDGGGLFLLVNPNGSKLWRLKYRFGGREKLLALGQFHLVSLKEARDKRDDAKKALLDGIDPAAHRQHAKAAAAVTFKEVGEGSLTKKHFSPATLAKARWLFDTWLFPDFGSRPLNAIKPTELLAVVRRAEATLGITPAGSGRSFSRCIRSPSRSGKPTG
jgi:hypothetical protein